MGKAIEVACPGGRVQGQQIAGIADARKAKEAAMN